nr:hypothetical protein [Tanacetum cinerariifolium]
METHNKKTLEQFQQETHDQFAKVNDVFQQLMNEFQTIKHERHDGAPCSRGKLILSGDTAKPYLKIQFPRFSGGDPTSWLNQASQYFEFQRPMTWAEFSQALLARFRPTDYENPFESLSRLKHTTMVAQYQESFEKLSHQVDGLPEDFLMTCYIGGLKDEVKLEVKMKKPRSLIDAMGLSRMAEEKLGLARKQSQPIRFFTTSSVGRLPPIDLAGILGPGPTTTLASHSPSPTRRISNTEAKARCEKGLCYYCDENYLPGHRCTKPQFFMIHDVGKNASGHRIKNKDVEVLIDGGSTHNFIDQSLVDRFGLIIDRESLLRILGLLVAAYSVVLGVQWLKTLCPVETDYQKLTIGFKIAGATHTLQGLKATELQAVSDNKLVALQGTLDDHLQYLSTVLEILATNKLYAKITKCCFGVSKVNYVGHVISSSRVAVDHSKVQAVLDWPTLKNAKGGYRIGLSFTVECDASGVGIGVILTQQGRLITYYSAPLKGSMLAWSTYEKEMLAIVRPIRKWRSRAFWIPQDFGSGKGEFLVVWDQRRGEKEDISTDFIEGLPTSNEFTTIMADWLSWAEFSYNTSIHSATKMTPFEVLYGRPPPRVLTYVLGTSKVQAVEEFLIDRDKFLRDLRSNLLVARDRMKSKADSKKHEVEFSVGDMVYLKLQPYMQSTAAVRDTPIPVSSEAGPTILPLIGSPPEAVLEERVVKKGKYMPKMEVLVKWKGFPSEEATWETKWRFQKAYPNFHLEDMANLSGRD